LRETRQHHTGKNFQIYHSQRYSEGIILKFIGCETMSKFSMLALPLIAAALSSCGIADHYTAQGRMEKSQDAYRSCLVSNSGDETKCATLKAIYEEDRAAYGK
jgi:hypothetical protein